jgi:dihydrofolate reductase
MNTRTEIPMSRTILYMSMSLDGFITGPNDGPGNAMGDGGMALHEWLWANAKPEDDPNTAIGKLTGPDKQIVDKFMASGSVVAGRGTFEGAHGWDGDHHDGVQIFILSRHAKPDWAADWANVHFGEDLAVLMRDAKAAAGDKDVMVHGAALVQEALRLGVLDELVIHLVPIVLGGGRSLFAEIGTTIELERVAVVEGGSGVTHLHYRPNYRG